jgi:hypothetical protein
MGIEKRRVAAPGDEDPTTMELWAAGELDDSSDGGGTVLVEAAMMVLLIGLVVFFVAFAPAV